MDQLLKKIITVALCLGVILTAIMTGTGVFADENDPNPDSGTGTDEGHIGALSPVILPDMDVTFNVCFDGKSAFAVSATFEYPAAVMEYRGFESKVNGFSVSAIQRVGENGVGYIDVLGISDDLVACLKGVIPVINFDFHINKDTPDQTAIYLKMIGATASDGERDYPISELSYNGTVTTKDTTVPVIESIKINGNPLDGFSPDVLEYSIKVEYSVTVLNLDIVCSEGTTASVRGNENLTVGENTVFIDVFTQTGNKHTYTVKVERLSDPNHVISTDATLLDVKLSAGFVTPDIREGVTDYLIYLPAWATQLTLEPVVTNEFARSEAVTVDIVDGENRAVKLSVTAESGLVCEYTFTLLVTPYYVGNVPMINGGNLDISKIDFSTNKGLYLPLPEAFENFFDEHGIGGTQVLVMAAILLVLLVAMLAVILLLLLKKKGQKNKKSVDYVDDSLEGAELIEKNDTHIHDDDIEANVF